MEGEHNKRLYAAHKPITTNPDFFFMFDRPNTVPNPYHTAQPSAYPPTCDTKQDIIGSSQMLWSLFSQRRQRANPSRHAHGTNGMSKPKKKEGIWMVCADFCHPNK